MKIFQFGKKIGNAYLDFSTSPVPTNIGWTLSNISDLHLYSSILLLLYGWKSWF